MVSSHQALFFIAPFKEREVHNPQALKRVFVAQSQSVAHFQAECAELGARFVGLITTKNKHQVAIFGTHFSLHFGKVFSRI